VNAGEFAGIFAVTNVEVVMPDPFAYTIAQVCDRACIGRTSLYAAIAAGDLVARKRGRRTFVLAEDLWRWLNTAPTMVSAPHTLLPQAVTARADVDDGHDHTAA
jgi:Helix-turn-helix domain